MYTSKLKLNWHYQTFDGTYCRKTLYKKLFKTVEIFKSVVDISLFPNYSLKRNVKKLAALCEYAGTDNEGTSETTTRILKIAERVSI